MKNNIKEIIKSKDIVIPLYIYKLLPKLNINLESFLFLMYLNSFGDKVIFNPTTMSEDFGISMEKVLKLIDELTTNKFISFEIIKNDKNVSEEYLSLDQFHEKIALLLIENINNNESHEISPSIFDKIEKEFGRVLSPIEYEIIKAWGENNISEGLIEEALKEAVFNGVNNLRYIDKILYEWQKKGLKTREDIERNRKEYKQERSKEEKPEIFEYNWLEDE